MIRLFYEKRYWSDFMDFRQLETFVAIAKFKSFSKAADYLFLTQPTISNHIQNLENQLGTILINRTNKKVTLTKAGEILYSHALDILNKRELALFNLEQFKGKIEGTLEIATSTTPEQYILPQFLNSFHRIYPDVKYHLLHFDSLQVVDSIINGEIDFGIVGAREDNKRLNYINLMADRLVVIAPNTAPYRDMNSISIDFLKSSKMILREEGSGTRKIFEQALHQQNISIDGFNVVAYIENTETIKQCVRLGLGLSIVSELSIADEVNFNFLKKIEIEGLDLCRNFYFTYHRYRTLSPLAETFKNYVIEHSHPAPIKQKV